MDLSLTISDVASLLNDPTFSFTSQKRVIRWINEARRNAARRTGCIRRLVSGQSAFGAAAQPGFAVPGAMQPGSIPGAFSAVLTGVTGAVQNGCMTIPGVERYPYEGFFNPFLRQAYAGVDKVIDSVAISVNWGGVSRPTLDWKPWIDFQAYCRAYAVLNTSYPSVWSVFNDGVQGEIWMFPIPSIAGEIELDAICTPKDIYSDNDYDVIPEGFHAAIKYGAAKLAFMGSLRYQQAQIMEEHFAAELGVARMAVDAGKTPSMYDTGF